VKKHSFSKYERLKSRKTIGQLFESGKSFHIFPIRIIYINQATDGEKPIEIKCAFTVPKRRFKKNADRNKIKRRMREAFRLHKVRLYQDYPDQIKMMIIYTGAEILPFSRIEEATIKVFDRLIN
jgi:ribonuclease P protein component